MRRLPGHSLKTYDVPQEVPGGTKNNSETNIDTIFVLVKMTMTMTMTATHTNTTSIEKPYDVKHLQCKQCGLIFR